MPIETLSLPFTNLIVSAPPANSYIPHRNENGNWVWVSPDYYQTAASGVDGVTGTGDISVNNTDPQNPVVGITATPSFTTVTATTFVGSVAAAHLQMAATTLSAAGTDTHIGINITAKGANGFVAANVGGNDVLIVRSGDIVGGADNAYDLGDLTLAFKDTYTSSVIQKGAAAEGYAQRKLLKSTATKSFAGEASVTIAVAVPAGAKIIGAALRNDTLVVLGGGGVSMTFAYTGGSTQVIEAGVALPKNTKSTKFYDANVDSDIASATTNITVTPDAGTLDSGSVTAVVFYEQLVALTDAA